jgi:hypothetical protein
MQGVLDPTPERIKLRSKVWGERKTRGDTAGTVTGC